MSSSQANSVGSSGWVVDGRAGGLGHSPLIPHLLPIVAPPEPHTDIVIPRQRNRLLFLYIKVQSIKTISYKSSKWWLERNTLLIYKLTLSGNRMGNQENIPGEWVSGLIPAHIKTMERSMIYVWIIRNLYNDCHGYHTCHPYSDLLSVTSP